MASTSADTHQVSFTGRVAGWSARHRWIILLGAIGLLVISFLLASTIGVKTSEVIGSGEARHGNKLIEERFDIVAPRAEVILLSNPNLDVTDEAFRSTVEALAEDLRELEGVASVGSYYGHGPAVHGVGARPRAHGAPGVRAGRAVRVAGIRGSGD